MNMLKNNVVVIAITTLALAVVGAFVWILIKGADTDKYVNFITWFLTVLPIIILGIVQSKNNATISNQVASVGQGVSNVETATNGVLSAKLDNQTAAIKDHIDSVIQSAIPMVPTNSPDPAMATPPDKNVSTPTLVAPAVDYTHTVAEVSR